MMMHGTMNVKIVKNVFVSIKLLHVSVFFLDHLQGSSAVFCAVTIPPADLRSLSLYCCAVCGRMCMSSVRVWCSCLLVIILFVLNVEVSVF
jgi:hypothetical protein